MDPRVRTEIEWVVDFASNLRGQDLSFEMRERVITNLSQDGDFMRNIGELIKNGRPAF